jgi:tryptophanyl-tRNA synthetase
MATRPVIDQRNHSMEVVLTGIKPTGTVHIGNYVGAIKPAVAASTRPGVASYLFLADYHAIGGDADGVARATLEIAASWLAVGLDPDKVVFYRQSDVPEILELQWILTSVTAKGLMNRAHAYKAAVADTTGAGGDPDQSIMMNLYSYPILMAADILMFKAAKVPVGRDQKQHVEMARDIAQRFNHNFGETFVLPEATIGETVATLPGLDGRKMSKSYGNVIPLFASEKELRKLVMRIKTNSLEPGQPKDPADSALFAMYQAFATAEETAAIAERYAAGIAWGEMKQVLFEYVNAELAPARAEYERLLAAPEEVERVLAAGAEKARAVSRPFLAEIRARVGIRPLARPIA